MPTKAKKKVASKSRKKSTNKRVDQTLAKITPTIQKKIDSLSTTLGKLPNTGDLKHLAYKILERAKDISAKIKLEAQRKTTKKRK
jgi:hypothetical protein